jgi:hypothetical protein
MRARDIFVGLALLLTAAASGASKIHIISFGKWTSVTWSSGALADEKPVSIRIRPLLVDGLVKEYVLGAPHDVTDRLFVIRRAFRVNDSLPADTAPRWQWQRGGWLLVDRMTGHVSAMNLAEFDPLYSVAAWYRDYAAYCGVGEDGRKTYMVVAQLNRRKPILKKALGDLPDDALPDSACPSPVWERNPARVTFEPAGSPKQTFAVRGRVVDVVSEEEE